MVANGCLFKQYTKELTPMYKLITSFTDNRSKFKKEMFKYEKGSEKFNKYNMLQMLAKRDNLPAIYDKILMILKRSGSLLLEVATLIILVSISPVEKL